MGETLDRSSELRAGAVAAALSVGDYLLEGFQLPMDTEFKRDIHDVVTMYDVESEKRIVSFLENEFPDSRFVGEEGGHHGSGAIEWHIDPIDGTANFARGIPLWCVSIAAVVGRRVVAGVVFDPVAGNMFSADDSGAWLGSKAIRARAASREIDGTIISSFPDAQDVRLFGDRAFSLQSELISSFRASRNLGSGALNLAFVAAGWADVTMGFATNSWDIAAGGFILQQAGGEFFGFDAGEEVDHFYACNDYYAVGGNVDYPTLRNLIITYSAIAPK